VTKRGVPGKGPMGFQGDLRKQRRWKGKYPWPRGKNLTGENQCASRRGVGGGG